MAKESEAAISTSAIQNSLKKEVNMEKSQVMYRVIRTSITLYLVFLRVLKKKFQLIFSNKYYPTLPD